MAKLHHLGFPRIGSKRQLKFALESFWHGESSKAQLQAIATNLRKQNWLEQQALQLDLYTVGDFSLYDQVLDTSFLVGNVPQRAQQSGNAKNLESNLGSNSESNLDDYFRVARGRSQQQACCSATHGASGETQAGEMTKWFNTNYHYIVPEFNAQTTFSLHAQQLVAQIEELQQINKNVKPVIIGPVTYLWLGKEKDNSQKLDLLPQLLAVYSELLALLATKGISWVQIDEPILVLELDKQWQDVLQKSYQKLGQAEVKLLLTTYFGQLKDNLKLACELPVAGLHLDAINAEHEINDAINYLGEHKVLSLGIINGCNIWKTDLNASIEKLIPIHQKLQDRLWLAPSSSLLHVPVDLNNEQKLDYEVKSWLAFAVQKLQELSLLGRALNDGIDTVESTFSYNKLCIDSRRNSERVHNQKVKQQVREISPELGQRAQGFDQRAPLQQAYLKLPSYPTTTIGSFPQTNDIRNLRKAKRVGDINETQYKDAIKQSIELCINEQNKIGLDVLVHGEAERND
ncbi:MAG: 5-methyltetrahydropteroyltriglutamate--homocysteine S-methyltransferase, partial [Psychromonas sp.]